jgi:long-chain acyl-CoA synthetase
MTNRALRRPRAKRVLAPWLKNYPPGVAETVDIPDLPLTAFLDRAAQVFGNRPAISFAGQRHSYAELKKLVDRAADGLQVLGVTKGIKVGLMMTNSAASVVMYYAVLRAGGTVVNFNPSYIVRDIARQVADSHTEIMVTLDAAPLLEKIFAVRSEMPLRHVVVCPAARLLDGLSQPVPGAIAFADLIANDGAPRSVDIDPAEDIAVLQYTGGTTGIPKGAMLTHRNLVANALQMQAWFHNAAAGQDKMVVVLPLFHVFAMTVAMNMPVIKGMEMLILPGFNVGDILSLVTEQRPAFIAAVPTMYIALANDKRAGEVDFSCLKFCLSGGAPLPADVKRAFEERTKAKLVAEGYGLTEFSPVATCNPITKKARAGTIGLPIPSTKVDIVSLSDRETVLPPGQKGEVVVSGPQMMKGYYQRPDETAEVIRNGRLHTGDVGYMDEDGFVTIVDRVKDMILVGGFNVYPRHIEEILYTHPAVEECIVAGVPDKLRGEAVFAWIKTRAGVQASPEDIKSWLGDKLSPIEIPKKITLRDQPLPRTSVGKLSKKDLLAQEGF